MQSQLRILHGTELTYAAITVAGFGVMGGLVGASAGHNFLAVFVLLIVGLILGAATVAGVDFLTYITQAKLRDQYGDDVIHHVVTSQFLMLTPFVLLGFAAQVFIGWDAAQSFTACGLLVVGANISAELVKLGARRVPALLVTAGSAFVFALIWIALTALIGGLWGK